MLCISCLTFRMWRPAAQKIIFQIIPDNFIVRHSYAHTPTIMVRWILQFLISVAKNPIPKQSVVIFIWKRGMRTRTDSHSENSTRLVQHRSKIDFIESLIIFSNSDRLCTFWYSCFFHDCKECVPRWKDELFWSFIPYGPYDMAQKFNNDMIID